MFRRKQQPENELLINAIDDALRSLDRMNPDDESYAKTVDQIVKLYALKRKPDRISNDALMNISANLLGILMIVGHERAHVVTSKAIGFVQKLR